MKLKHVDLIYVILLLINIFSLTKGNKQSIDNSIKIKDISRKLQSSGSDNYISLSFDSVFQTDTCWYSQIITKISKVSVNYEEVTGFPISFNIPEGGSVQIYFNDKLNDLSYFLSYNDDLEEEFIPNECKIDDHFKSHIITIDLENLDVSEVTTTAKMFKGYTALTRIYLFNMNTATLLSMNGMFMNCISLNSIDLSNLHPTQVIDMGYMFAGCSSLESLSFYNFNTWSATNME